MEWEKKQRLVTHLAAGWIAPALVAGLCIAAIAMRVYALGRLPGINGDEAWAGVQAQLWAAGTIAEWRTPSGNLPGPIQLGEMRLLHMGFEPSFTLLRLPSLLSSLFAMGLAYGIGRRFFDRATAAIALVLMSALPANIVYARFGWDPSHSGAVVLAAVWAALAGRPLVTALIFAIALWAHPTNVFAAPLLVLGFAGSTWTGEGRVRRIALLVVLMIAALAVLSVTTTRATDFTGLHGTLERLFDPRDWLAFLVLLGRMLNGDTVFTYIVGRGYDGVLPIADSVAVAAILLTLWAGVVKWRRGGFSAGVGLIAGWAASLVLFFLLAGNTAIMPHTERYAFVLVAPSALAFAIALRTRLSLALAGIGMPLLAASLFFYLLPLERSGSQSHRAFWTGNREPKATAAAVLAAERQPMLIMAEDWWLAWPIAYLSDPKSVAVINDATRKPVRTVPGVQARRIFWVVFAGSPLDRRLAGSGAEPRATIAGTSRPALLRIWVTPGPAR